MRCNTPVARGRRAGLPCGNTATFVVVEGLTDATRFVCGNHAQTWARSALIRLAHWDAKEQAWL